MKFYGHFSSLDLKRLFLLSSLSAIIGLLATVKTYGQTIGSKDVFNQSLISDRIVSERLTYRMSQSGDSAGVSVLTYAVGEKSLRLHEGAKVMVGEALFDETIDALYDFENGKMTEQEITIDYGGRHTEMKGKWSSQDKIEVSIGTLDSTIMAGEHIPRIMTLFLLPRMYYDKQDQLSYRQFNLMDLQLRDIKATVTGQVDLDLPLGQYSCYRMELRDGVASQDLYIDPETHRIVHIKVPDQGWEYDLVKVEELL